MDKLLHLPSPVGIFFDDVRLNIFYQDHMFILAVLLKIAEEESEKAYRPFHYFCRFDYLQYN